MRTRLSSVAPLLVVLFGSTSAAHAQPVTVLKAVPTDSFAFITVNVGKLWDNPDFKPLRGWFEAQKVGPTDEALGLGAGEIERVTLFMSAAPKDGVPVLLVTTKKPYNEARVLKALGAAGANRGGRVGNAVRISHGEFATAVLGDERTLMLLPETRGDLGFAALLGQFAAKKADGALAAALSDAGKHDIAFAIDVRPLAALVQFERDAELTPFLTLFKAQTVAFTADFDKTATGTLRLAFSDEAVAKRAAPVLTEGISEIADRISKELVGRKNAEPTEQAMLGAFVAVLKAAKVDAAGTTVVATADLPYQDAVAKVAAALPKSYTAAANSTRGQNNLKQLALAFHNYESAMGFFPSDVLPVNGPKPPAMSWRVQILPYIEQAQLYNQLDMTKAWDDPANLQKLEAMEMPKVFEIPGRPAPKGYTYFRVFSLPKNAKGTARPWLVEGQRGGSFAQITDGTSNTFMIVEAGEAVPWYKPDVLAYDGKLPLPQLGDKSADRFIVAMGDGSVRVLRPSKVGETTLRAFITISGGEVINLP